MNVTRASSRSAPETAADLTQYANRTLDFLNIIEKTLKSVTRDVDLIRILTAGVRRHTEAVRANDSTDEIDPAGRATELFTKAAAAAYRNYLESIGYRDSARRDANLFEDDGVVECFCDLVEAFADLHNALEELREAVENHDAAVSPVIGTFDDVESLIAALKS